MRRPVPSPFGPEITMPEVWIPLTLIAVALAAAGYFLFPRRSLPPLEFGDEREERLTRQMARIVGCPLEAALPAVRREIEMSAHQSDETLVKRAVYHYRQELPETTCRTYRDPAPG
jgi:hypothetical protein